MLTDAQLARRIAREVREGERVYLGPGVPQRVREYLPPGCELRGHASNGAPARVIVVAARAVGSDGSLLELEQEPATQKEHSPAAPLWPADEKARGNGALRPSNLSSPGRTRTVAVLCRSGPGAELDIRPPDVTQPRARAVRLLSDLAVIDVTKQGLVVRELAPGVSARDLQTLSPVPLYAEPGLADIESE